MRRVKLALLACRGAGEGPWIRAQGNETEIKISDMGAGEHVELKIVVGEIRDSAWFFSPGVHPIPFKRMERYQIIKHVQDGVMCSLATNVEVVLNGTGAE